ncbi:MAG: hypothetical protein KY467_06020 [Gemmatimonadetes bacterium]|nr:hypothetical protein [Gemmatimonadota bacterium]
MTRARLSACAALVLLLGSGCIDFLPVSGPTQEDLYVHLFLKSRNAGPGSGADSLRVDAFVSSASPGLSFSDGTLHVAGQRIEPAVQRGEWWGYSANLVLPPGTLTEPFRIKLPVPDGVSLPVQEIIVSVVARGGPDTLTLRAGADLVLPIGGSAHRPPTRVESWDLYVQRGFRSAEIRSTGPLPAQVVVPASLVPQDSAPVMEVLLNSHRQLRWDTAGSRLSVDMQGTLRWSVRVVP